MKEKERLQYEKLVLTPVGKLIPALAVPTVISMMVTMIYNLVDAFFVEISRFLVRVTRCFLRTRLNSSFRIGKNPVCSKATHTPKTWRSC